MPSMDAKSFRDNIRSVNLKVNSGKSGNRFSSQKSMSDEKVLSVECDTDLVFNRGDVVKILENKVMAFDGTEAADDDIVPGVVKVGNWAADGYTYVQVLVDGTAYVYSSEAVSIGDKLCPANDDTDPIPVKVWVKKAVGEDVPRWVALEEISEAGFVKVKFFVQSGSGGYNGMFKLTAYTETEDEVDYYKYKVNDSSNGMNKDGSRAMVNGELLSVPEFIGTVDPACITPEGDVYYYVILKYKVSGTPASVQLDDPYFDIVSGFPAYADGYGCTLIGRIRGTSVTVGETTTVTFEVWQDHYGMVQGLVFGECE